MENACIQVTSMGDVKMGMTKENFLERRRDTNE